MQHAVHLNQTQGRANYTHDWELYWRLFDALLANDPAFLIEFLDEQLICVFFFNKVAVLACHLIISLTNYA